MMLCLARARASLLLPSGATRSYWGRGAAAFAWDIDGVIRRGGVVLEPAREAFQKHLYEAGQQRYPVAFLTNAGGQLESEKAAALTEMLGVPVRGDQVVCSHTPMRTLVPTLGERTVLVAGRGHVKEVARAYGFQRVITCEELGAIYPHAAPFSRENEGGAGGGDVLLEAGTEACPIDAVLVMTDPTEWGRDLQIICDVVSSGGVLGRFAEDAERKIPVYFSQMDLLWPNPFPTPRFGLGAFKASLRHLFERTYGRPLEFKAFGKPNREPYSLVEGILLQQAADMGLSPAGGAPPSLDLFSGIYMIGDNPAADVRGANAAGAPWVSVLVRSGVFRGPPGGNDPSDPAHIVTEDALAAVEAALHHTRKSHWHQHR